MLSDLKSYKFFIKRGEKPSLLFYPWHLYIKFNYKNEERTMFWASEPTYQLIKIDYKKLSKARKFQIYRALLHMCEV